MILATGYVYDFPFFDGPQAQSLGLRFHGQRHVTPLYLHLLHAEIPSLGFIGVPLSVPCPIPFFEIQAAYLGEHWAFDGSFGQHAKGFCTDADGTETQPGAELSTKQERIDWVATRLESVGPRLQDMHLMGAPGGKNSSHSAWAYMRLLLKLSRLPPQVTDTWLSRMETVKAVYDDRSRRKPSMPWDDDEYRRCQYEVDWDSGTWKVDEGI